MWLPANAQPRRNNIEAVKAAFITQKLELTPEESQRFWPVYNNYQQELKKLILIKNSQRRALKENAEAEPVDELEIDGEILELRKRYRGEFAKVLPRQKAALVYPTEREFRQQLIEQLQKRTKKN